MTTNVRSVSAWDRETVEAFDRGGEDVLIVERPPLPGVAQAVALARVHDSKAKVRADDATALAAAALAALGIDSPLLAGDVAALAAGFLAQFRVGAASMRVEVTDRTPCPKFHCDNLRMRLVTTYHGPTTEYVRTDAPEDVRAAPLFALVFLKGHKHPNHADRIHHRSPALPPGGRRLCVILDV